MTPNGARVFRAVEAAAAQGLRCPTRHDFRAVREWEELTIGGHIKIDIYALNYKVVTVLTGPYKGKSTKLPDHGRPPWRTISRETIEDEIRSKVMTPEFMAAPLRRVSKGRR